MGRDFIFFNFFKQMFFLKKFSWLDSNPGPLVLGAIGQPTVPQPSPC